MNPISSNRDAANGATLPALSPVVNHEEKPHPLEVRFDAIPDDLKQHPNFVLWRYEWRGDKWTKPPSQPSGFKAKPNDLNTWHDFDTISTAYARGGFDGIGFMLEPELGIIGIDLDHVCDPATSELTPIAQSIVDDLDTYTEISPSGTGLRLFIYAPTGTLPREGRKRGSFEIYDSVRYLTLTGHQLDGTPKSINQRTDEVHAFHTQFIATPKAPENGSISAPPPVVTGASRDDATVIASVQRSKHAALWYGDVSAYKGESEADYALISCLGKMCNGDADQVERIIRQSDLWRSKWDEKRGEGTYLSQSIRKALGSLNASTPLPRGERSTPRPISIPTPSRKKNDKPAYDSEQLVQLVRPEWECVSLETHAANALRIEANLKDAMRFCGPLGWFHFDGRRWVADDGHSSQGIQKVTALSSEVRNESGALLDLAGTLTKEARDDDAQALAAAAFKLADHAAKVEAVPFAKMSLEAAAGKPSLRISVDAFDQRPWLLGFENGVWDRGTWRNHDRGDYLIHLCPLPYAPLADRTEWEALLERMVGGDAGFARTLQDVAGYVLSGASTLRSLPWLYGPKGTGKSTFAELLQTLLGGMATTVDPARLGADANARRGALGATLWNKRLAVCSEAGNSRLDAELLKTLSGSDRLTVEFKYKEPFDALPRHVLMMVGNDAPRMNAYDEALRDRVIALPFEHPLDHGEEGKLRFAGHDRIESARRDPSSPLVVGFAAWAMDGLLRVYETQTIHRAECIERATAKFWEDTDPLTEFWETVDRAELMMGIFKPVLWDRYVEWCKQGGIRPVSPQVFNKAVESRGYEVKPSNGKRRWVPKATR